MKYHRVEEAVGDLPYIKRQNAKMLYDFIVRHEIRQVLELGFAHGVSSCFIAAALDEVSQQGSAPTAPTPRLTTIDLLASHLSPSIEELLGDLGLEQLVDVHRTSTGYHWFLRDEIQQQSAELRRCRPKYDLVIHDCCKDWTHLSSGFFLTDKLLKPGGWIAWDDLRWTYANADRRRSETYGIRHASLSEAERQTPAVWECVRLLAMQHPNYGTFRIVEDGAWVWARKASEGEIVADSKRLEIVRSYSMSWYVGRLLRGMYRAGRSLYPAARR